MPPDLSIIIPCYNEANRLPRTLRETAAYFRDPSRSIEIIVVSDGSEDDTKAVSERELGHMPAHITGLTIEYRPNCGKGEAVKRGMLRAMGNRVLFMDADYAVPLSDIRRADALLDQGYDVAIGSRALDDTILIERQSFIRERMSKLFGFIQRNWLGLKLLDTQCGFKLFTSAAAKQIFPNVKLTSVIFDGEVLWLAKRLGLKVVEFPVKWTHDPDSRITYSPVRAIKVFGDMMRIPALHMKQPK